MINVCFKVAQAPGKSQSGSCQSGSWFSPVSWTGRQSFQSNPGYIRSWSGSMPLPRSGTGVYSNDWSESGFRTRNRPSS